MKTLHLIMLAIATCAATTFAAGERVGHRGNMLANPGLEAAQPLNWFGSSAVVERVTGQAHTGRACVRIIDRSDSRGQGSVELFPVEPGDYYAEAWVRSDPDFSPDADWLGGIRFSMQFFDSEKGYISTADLGVVMADDWTRVGGKATAPPNVAFASLRVVPTNAGDATPEGKNTGPAQGACFADDLYFAPLEHAGQDGRLKVYRPSDALDEAGRLDESLVIHYRFDSDPGETATDLSGFGNDGQIVDGKFLDEAEGRRGVLRLNGETSYINSGNTPSMHPYGDLTFEMWARFNQPIEPSRKWPVIFGEYPPGMMTFIMPYTHTLAVWYRTPEDRGAMWLPVHATYINDQWAHIAMVFEYPRCRFYRNGELYRDAYMPLPGVQFDPSIANYNMHIGGGADGETYAAPMDLTEFRMYRRALSAEEIAAHAKGNNVEPPAATEMIVEPNWYKDIVTFRYVCKGDNVANQRVNFTIHPQSGDSVVASASARFSESMPGSERYVAAVDVPMSSLQGSAFRVQANGKHDDAADFVLEKPEWIHSQAGISDKVQFPWTPVTTQQADSGAVDVGVWGRTYSFDAVPFLQQVESGGEPLLTGPIALNARADGQPVQWHDTPVELTDASDTAASLEQLRRSGAVNMHVSSSVEYDGFITITCEVKANRKVSLDELTLEIPMSSIFAEFCAGDYVLPKQPNVSNSAMFRGAIEQDLSFRFGPTVWMGNDYGGISWQAETDEDWRYADEQRAIEILPRGETTYFRAHFIDVPTELAAGESLRYEFALQATPLKPLYRDAWSMRIGRSEPYGADLDLPDKVINGMPALEYLASTGLRHLFINVNDEFPWPMPRRQRFKDALLRLNNEAHEAGLNIYCYAIHARIPVMRPEFDIYGEDMLIRPSRQYLQTASRPLDRPGPVPWKPDMLPLPQGSVDFCPRSDALRDAYMHALNQRVTQFGDDGVYLDGTYVTEPCLNPAHGCGYRGADGKMHPTYAVFDSRKMMQRIYTIVHENNPDGVVDLHSSFFFNPSGIAYADVIWTGEQWYELRFTGAGYIAGTLSLDMFRTEFTGWNLGVPAETLHYRLGEAINVAATSLLHDISPRMSTNAYEDQSGRWDPYFKLVPDIWKMRDMFGMTDAEKLFYFENEEYVTVSPQKCYATLFKHPTNGVLAFVSNLTPDAQDITVQLDLDELRLSGKQLDVYNPLTNEPVSMTADGTLSISLGSELWAYVWLRPATR
jgi:hypothetical protein